MKVIKTKILFFIYFSIFFFLIFELLFSEKNIFKLFDNFEIIIGKEIELEEKKKEYSILESFLKIEGLNKHVANFISMSIPKFYLEGFDNG